ncbi:MAG TPA: hypothetical protein VK155_08235 [Bacteroidales bacterium]|jgi:hypothetical protein|nr:hypothetical protein [Bacteroidales bacterium]
MKKISIIAASLVSVALLCSCGSSSNKTAGTESTAENALSADAALPAIHKYGIKSGIVTFENSGFGLTFKQVLYFDDYGTKEAVETYDPDGTLKETNLCDGKNRYILIHKDKAAFPQGECFRGVAYKFDWNEVAQAGNEYKPTKLANVSIAGKDCESFSLDVSGNKTVYAGWNNVCFLIDTESMGAKVLNKALTIEENASVPGDKLKVPGDYKMN